MLAAGLALLPALTRAQALAALEIRLSAQEAIRAEAEEKFAGWQEPPHVRELYRLRAVTAAGDVAWTSGLIERLRAGEYAMAGEAGSPGKAGSWPSPA